MHDYTAWQVHEDRMRDFAREADAYRLAAIAKHGLAGRQPRTLRRWLAFGWSRIALWQSRPDTTAALPDSGAATALSVSSGGDR